MSYSQQSDLGGGEILSQDLSAPIPVSDQPKPPTPAPIMATRASSRSKGTGMPIHIRAKKRVAAAYTEGNISSFVAFNSIDNSSLATMALDSGIYLSELPNTIDKRLQLLKVREVAQAALAAAASNLADQENSI